jgi:LDH2 family malate/lactate/ureidoglycolate dehydrogenase
MGAKAICMENTLNEKRAAVYWFRRVEGISSDGAVAIVMTPSRASLAPTGFAAYANWAYGTHL